MKKIAGSFHVALPFILGIVMTAAVSRAGLIFDQEGHATAIAQDGHPKAIEQNGQKEAIEKAIAQLRNLHPRQMSEAEQGQLMETIDSAWGVLIRSGRPGVGRVKLELKIIDEQNIKDDFFNLNAAAFLWRVRSLSACQTIADIWSHTPLDAAYGYVFNTAFEAAGTQNPGVLPMLKQILHDDKGGLFLNLHQMNVGWPLTHEFVWGRFGPKGLRVLLDMLKTSKTPVEQRSAIILLTHAQYLKALPVIRKLAKSEKGDVGNDAIEWLGEFGHPQDFDFLLTGLNTKSTRRLKSYIVALQQYEDLRASSPVAAILTNPDASVRKTAIDCLATLVTDSALRALHDHSLNTKDPKERTYCDRIVKNILSGSGLKWDLFASKKPEERKRLLRKGDTREEAYRLHKGDRTLTHRQLLRVIKSWKKRHSIQGGKYAWVESRHILAVAKPADIVRLLDLRAAVYGRLSDECLEEVEILDDLVRRIGRHRYRREVGICEKVEGFHADDPANR